MRSFLKLEGQAKDDFYQAKYEYYRHFNLGTLFISSIMFFVLLVPFWQVYEQFSWQSLAIRCLVVIPLTVVFLAYRKTRNYKIMSVLSLLMVHAMIWGNIWSATYMTDHSYVNEGFLIMNVILMLVSFSAPPFYTLVAQLALIGNILLANQLFHFANLDVILSFNVKAVVLLCLVNLIITGFYYDHYITKKKLEFALFHDPLTRVFNRRQLHKIMGEGHDLSFMSNDIVILIMDVDHFKQVNDTYGHDEGDRILQFAADCIRHCLRGPDLLIRWGGEEFVAILSDCQRDQASVVAERIRRSVEMSVNGVCKITLSLGVAIYEGGDCFETIKKADQALFVAKHNGRNQVVYYESLDQDALEATEINGQTNA